MMGNALRALALATTLFLATSALASEPTGPSEASRPGVFVLGIDGMDPVILQRLMDEGKMPEFKKLAAEGCFQNLGTSNPPQSPVAWSNFVTGMNPGGHGIFDFIHRDPATYGPISSATPPPSHDEPSMLNFFGYAIPLGGDELVNNRSGKPFWDYLHEAGVTTEIYRVPGNYPPTPSEALTLSGMGTVDMRGTAGTYSWYTDELLAKTSDLKADLFVVSADDEDGDGYEETYATTLSGPPDSMRTDAEGEPLKSPLTAPLTITVSPDHDVAWVRIGSLGAVESQAIMKVGEWSDWLNVSFEPMPMMPMGGVVRFYLKEVRPNLKLYASPVNIDPAAPAQPITTPDDDVAVDLFGAMGGYYTQGMPEEVNALKDGLFDDDDYLAQVALVHEDGHLMLDLALQRFEPGHMTFMYLSDIDLQCHMLWRHGDPKYLGAPHHPAYEAAAAAKHKLDIENFYRTVDGILGKTREQLPDDTLLMVMSDHGFQPYLRQVHLNAWLHQNGYLVLNGDKQTGQITGPIYATDNPTQLTPLHDVDWSRTRAYAFGFNGIYFNLEGREGEAGADGGIVTAAEAGPLADEIIAGLTALTDPKNGLHPILRVDRAIDIYSGSRVAEAPDLIVGYDRGYGCSDRSTLGTITAELFVDNEDRWSGNHLMAPEVVPGILLMNRRISADGHDLTDVTASLLDYFGLAVPEDMVGASFLR
jgi:predicted AlkP superfamily phosphohydrolase/phosphomutase